MLLPERTTEKTVCICLPCFPCSLCSNSETAKGMDEWITWMNQREKARYDKVREEGWCEKEGGKVTEMEI